MDTAMRNGKPYLACRLSMFSFIPFDPIILRRPSLKKVFGLIQKIFVGILSVGLTYTVLKSRQRHHECGESASGLYKWDIV